MIDELVEAGERSATGIGRAPKGSDHGVELYDLTSRSRLSLYESLMRASQVKFPRDDN
jgi:hypothetical protein